MNNSNVIEVKDVYKKYKNYFDKSHNLKEKVLNRDRRNYEESWVLKGISFEVKKGEAVGLIGRNGCGKSTTLKLLTKIIYPDQGSIEIKGRVSSLLELGAGFHPDLSGYENIYLNAAVFGLTRKEIDKRVDEIIRFSELEEYINNPIRTYSSGMYMKLAFSVAINVNADILLIDEILGVGDVSYQKKCFEKLMEIKKSGTTIVIVSHSTDQIEKICDRSIWIEDGNVKMQGMPEDVHEQYLDIMEHRRILQKQKEDEERRKENINKIRQQTQLSREQERVEIEKRKAEREMLRSQNVRKTLEKDEYIKLQSDEDAELEKQRVLLAKAEHERKKQKLVIDNLENTETAEGKPEIMFLKSETNRLESVVSEKNYEIERLNSVIKQKDILLEKKSSDMNEEVVHLDNVVIEKDDEIDRLNSVIVEKQAEIDRLNIVIMEKNLEIENYQRGV